MCDYCNGKKVLLEGNDGYGFFLNNSIMTIIEQADDGSFILDDIFIDYCPKCGRNLNE